SSFSILSLSPALTRYCLPPVLMTAYMGGLQPIRTQESARFYRRCRNKSNPLSPTYINSRPFARCAAGNPPRPESPGFDQRRLGGQSPLLKLKTGDAVRHYYGTSIQTAILKSRIAVKKAGGA